MEAVRAEAADLNTDNNRLSRQKSDLEADLKQDRRKIAGLEAECRQKADEAEALKADVTGLRQTIDAKTANIEVSWKIRVWF